jgi:hypothetical protein
MPNALRRWLPYTYGRADENLARRTEVRFLARTIVRVESACSGAESRHLFNQLVHEYLNLGAQIGAQVSLDKSGAVGDVCVVVRPVLPEDGCLWCSGASPQRSSTARFRVPKVNVLDSVNPLFQDHDQRVVAFDVQVSLRFLTSIKATLTPDALR